jgi:hypothetical protein
MHASASTTAVLDRQPAWDDHSAYHARLSSALDRYVRVESDFEALPEGARHAILEIGSGLQGLRAATSAAEPAPAGGPCTAACESWEPCEPGEPPPLVVTALRCAMDPYLAVISREIGTVPAATWRVASRFFHERFGELVDTSPLAGRCFRKPLGYAGDFEMMNMVYRNQSVGSTLFGMALSRIVLDSDAGRAVRNRTGYLAEKIEAAVTRRDPARPARILSVAAGPAMELQLMLQLRPALLTAGCAEIALLDQDASALEHARSRIEALAAQAGVSVTLRCINTPIRRVILDGLDDSYDLVYSAGLFDYLTDRTVRAAGERLVAALEPGGTAVIGNFDVANPTRPFMELVLDWPLHHRSADDLRGLFSGLGTGVTIEREAAGVNLFAVIGA